MPGRSADLVFTPDDWDHGIPEREMADACVRDRGLDDLRHVRKDGTRFWTSCETMPLKGAAAERHVGHVKIRRDRTRQRKAERHREDLTQELARRMKNILAMVQAIATQTVRAAKSSDEGREALSGRLLALGRAQDILTGSGTDATRIRHLVDDALRPHRSGEGRIFVEGPSAELSREQGPGLSLAIHELATNTV